MRSANVVVSVVGTIGVLLGAVMAWKWRHLEREHDDPTNWSRRDHAVFALRDVLVVLSAGTITGVLVLGFGGRLVMRALAATSGDGAQGRLTEADEVVGQITAGGTIAFLVFVGLLGGLVTAALHLVARRWLPRRADRLGAILAVVLVGTIGVLDPLSPDNVDFAILRPRWLAVLLVAGCGVLFALAYAACVTWLDGWVRAGGSRRFVLIAAAPMALAIFVPVVAAVYVGARAFAQGRFSAVLDRHGTRLVGRWAVAIAILLAGFTATRAIVDILA
ncbi:MAG: alpha/beta-hydrolase N-terminal domain-containing protein [Acidimicrobiia bacterium]